MIIRLATPDDAPALAELRYQFRAALDPPREARNEFLERCGRWMRERLAARTWRCWVADQDGSLMGSVWLLRMEKLPNPVGEGEFYGYVSNLYVTKELRATGLGSDLLARCLEACDAERFDSVFLWPTARSRSLYLRHGFAAGGEMMVRRIGPSPAHDGPA
jgi:GNAT superfamily N-acetyltransferase